MRRGFIFFIFFLNASLVFPQKEKTKQQIDKYLEKTFDFIDTRNLDSASFYLEKVNSSMLEINTDSALYYRQQLAYGALIMRKENREDALKIFLNCLTFFKNSNDRANIGLTYYQIAICNYFLNRRSYALDYFKKAELFGEFLPKKIRTRILQNFGTVNLEEGMSQKDSTLFLKAIDNYKNAAKIYEEEKWIDELSVCTSLLSECYIQLNRLDEALSTVNKAIQYGEEAKNDNYIGFGLIKKNSILNKKNKNLEALETINKAIKIYRKSDDKNTLKYAYEEKKKSLVALKRFEEAYIASDSIYALTILIYNTRLANGVTEMEAKYKTAEKEKEIAQQKLSIKNKNIFSLILGASILILGILIVGLYKRHQFKQKQFRKEMDLKDALAKIKTQNKLQEQRLEISRDLHDNIGSQLTFIISSIDNLNRLSVDASKIVKEKLSNISGFTAETIDQLRDTIWAMNKNEVSFEDLYSRLLSYTEKAKKFTPRTSFSVTENSMDGVIFNSVLGMNLFRVIQEGINNAIKHSEAKNIHILFDQKVDTIEIEIKDDGKGFDKNNLIAGNGLSNIEDRISSVKGKVFIHSERTKGTSIKIQLDKVIL